MALLKTVGLCKYFGGLLNSEDVKRVYLGM